MAAAACGRRSVACLDDLALPPPPARLLVAHRKTRFATVEKQPLALACGFDKNHLIRGVE